MAAKRHVSISNLRELNTKLASTGHQLVTTDSDPVKYERCIERWSVAAMKPAGAVLVPESIEAISVAVRYATDNHIDLAVRGGGHSTAGTSSTDGGLLIDLGSSTLFTHVEVDETHGHIIAGGGANWGGVDDAGFAAGLVTVGGTVHDTGIGGLTLGGGYGWLSGKLGLTIDNLVSVKLVVADGQVLAVSRDQNPDLFWALRGAGQNFGVAVQVVYQGHTFGIGPPAKQVAGAKGGQAYAGTICFPTALLSPVLRVLNRLFGSEGTLKGGIAAGGFAVTRQHPVGGHVIILIPLVWLGDEESGTVAFKELFDLQPYAKDMKMMDYPGVNRLFHFELGMRVSMKGCAFKLPIREGFAKEFLELYSEFTSRIPDAARSVLQFDLFDPTVVATKASNTDMAFSNRGYHLNAAAEMIWQSPQNDELCRKWARDIAAMFKAELQRPGGDRIDAVAGQGSKGLDNNAVMIYGNLERKSAHYSTWVS